ncbi:predicted protein [Chaetomium globosum CBS 148.51]|uniref:Sch210972 biosynthesis cluster protein E n=1 Tax=Chaetomium globosum (strain ATCC 6205 / CBS 148.51 / DSM 1962 / NBRC 6347 / NRRL 1970) TaxID=306901 RepID=CGHE_CHAGB|nr:uncharacterized protein CHGG_02372 [Chaetomium globosum CBS 148.51]Q2HBN2.1 RecName: Full=Sch210972 biosynthesis cluster protein E [Chaetomium globosum CBS 148.51]EAQ90437.1 predicted protein [Chaetomium globosum CBS 148.51]
MTKYTSVNSSLPSLPRQTTPTRPATQTGRWDRMGMQTGNTPSSPLGFETKGSLNGSPTLRTTLDTSLSGTRSHPALRATRWMMGVNDIDSIQGDEDHPHDPGPDSDAKKRCASGKAPKDRPTSSVAVASTIRPPCCG